MTEQAEIVETPTRKAYQFFDEAAQERAINFCRDHGRYVKLMAKAAGVSKAVMTHYLNHDESFKERIDEVLEERSIALENEARRRAIEGVTRRKYDKDGKLLEEEQVYSDRLMERLLEADIEKFKPKSNPFGQAVQGGVLLIPLVAPEKARSAEDLAKRLEDLSVIQHDLEQTEGGTKKDG